MTRVAAGPTRRVVLAVPVTVLAAGCTGSSRPDGLTPAQVVVRDQARDRATASERDLVARYDAALAQASVSGDQALTARLRTVRAEHAAHLAALQDGTVPVSTPAGTPTPTPTPTPPPPTGTSMPVGSAVSSASGAPGTTQTSSTPPPTDAKTVVAGLVSAEQDAANRLTSDVLTADGHTAQLLASIAASESGHAALLLGGAA